MTVWTAKQTGQLYHWPCLYGFSACWENADEGQSIFVAQDALKLGNLWEVEETLRQTVGVGDEQARRGNVSLDV